MSSSSSSFSAREHRNSFLVLVSFRRAQSKRLPLAPRFRMDFGHYGHVDFGHDHPVVCPAFCTSHGPAHKNVFDVTTSHDDIVNQVPMFRAWVHPRSEERRVG